MRDARVRIEMRHYQGMDMYNEWKRVRDDRRLDGEDVKLEGDGERLPQGCH